LIRQYEYEEGAEDDGPDVSAARLDSLENEEVKENNAESKSTEELQLEKEEEKLSEMEADLSNEANNYMRSKQEIKQLQIQLKKMKQQVGGLRKKVERERARQRQQLNEAKEMEGEKSTSAQQQQQEAEDEEEAHGVGLFDMDIFGTFQNDDIDGGEGTSAEIATPQAVVEKFDGTIPKGWTGTTPQKKLDEICKKQKLPRPKYTKLPSNAGFRLTVVTTRNSEATELEAKHVDFYRDSSLKDYLATRALYSIDPTLQLYLVFPPVFRDLWLSWIDLANKEKKQAAKELGDAKQKRLDYLIGLISSSVSESVENDGDDTESKIEPSNVAESIKSVPLEWDEDTSNNGMLSKPEALTRMGMKLQSSFKKRQSTKPYQDMKTIRDMLPMASFRQPILDAVRQHPVTILRAETGAGKTTQCPQFLLEEDLLEGRGDRVQILCTQPRRVAAISVAERVAEEMCEPLGNTVGYQIRMESKRSANTKLLFCTTGIILRRLQDDRNLKGVTTVIVDEVHERQQQTDILLVMLRKLLSTTRPDLKVILMSATMDSDLFCSFFQGAPIIDVPGRTFPVAEYFLEDLLEATGHIIEEGSFHAIRDNRFDGEKSSLWVTTKGGEKRREVVDLSSANLDDQVLSEEYIGYSTATRKSMERVNEAVINFDLIEDVLAALFVPRRSTNYFKLPDGTDLTTGAILVFLPGLGEIKSLTERLDTSRIFGDKRCFQIIPMHSKLSSQDQRKAFAPAMKGCRKIILSTNVAETSVTIPDVTCVIDSGRIREVKRSKRFSTSVLALDWCSKASAKQRAGRAGRVRSGFALKLYSSHTAAEVMKASSEPELRRVPLEEVCLSILASGFARSCMDFLAEAPQPPDEESVRSAVKTLHDVGAIESPDANAGIMFQSEKLTPLGAHLAKLPVDVRLGKMLIFGALFRCIDPIVSIAASLSSQSPFSTFISDEAVAKAKQRTFMDPDSDFRTYCNLWDAYTKITDTSATAGRKFCHENYLNFSAMREIGEARLQFIDLLEGIGFLDRKPLVGEKSRIDPKLLRSSVFNEHGNKQDLIDAVICAGLYPNVAHIELSPSNNGYSVWHKDERLYFHNDSVFASRKRFNSSETWVVFHEKFGTSNRTSISTVCFAHPIVFILFGGPSLIKHTERLVIVDGMQIAMAAQTAVILSELRNKLDRLLKKMVKHADMTKMTASDHSMIDGIINIITL